MSALDADLGIFVTDTLDQSNSTAGVHVHVVSGGESCDVGAHVDSDTEPREDTAGARQLVSSGSYPHPSGPSYPVKFSAKDSSWDYCPAYLCHPDKRPITREGA